MKDDHLSVPGETGVEFGPVLPASMAFLKAERVLGGGP